MRVLTGIFLYIRMQVSELGKVKHVLFIGMLILKDVSLDRMRAKELEQALVVAIFHLYIHIIIPGNKPSVSHRSEAGAGGKPIFDAMSPAIFIKSLQHLQQAHLHLA